MSGCGVHKNYNIAAARKYKAVLHAPPQRLPVAQRTGNGSGVGPAPSGKVWGFREKGLVFRV